MHDIVEETLQACDVVVIDTPPALAVTDASVLASGVDGVLLVFKPGSTRRGVARQAVQQLQRANARILGVVLNNLDLGRAGYGYRYYYHKYYPTYNKYYVSEDGTRTRTRKTKKSTSDKAETNS
jgi:Mrp family chromosome partitioning ATPase